MSLVGCAASFNEERKKKGGEKLPCPHFKLVFLVFQECAELALAKPFEVVLSVGIGRLECISSCNTPIVCPLRLLFSLFSLLR